MTSALIERMARAIWVGEPGCIEQHVLNTGGFRPELTVEQQGMEICRELATLALCAALEPTEVMIEAAYYAALAEDAAGVWRSMIQAELKLPK